MAGYTPAGWETKTSGGGFWRTDNDGMDVGGRETSTPAPGTGAAAGGGGGGGGPGGQQEIGSGGGVGDGGAAEEMDRDESAPTPDGWWKMTRDQKRRFRQNQKKRQGKVV